MRRGPTRSRRSLRTRLLVALVVPLVAVLAVVGVVSVTALRHQLVGQVDARLDAATDRSRDYTAGPGPGHGRPGDGGPGPAFLGARGQGEGTLGATITDGAVTSAGVLGARGQEIELSAAQQTVLVGLPPGGGPATLDLGGDLGSYRVVADPAPGGDVLVTGLPLAGTADAVRNLVLVELLAGLLALLAAAGVAVLVVRRTLRPLDRVAATATRVSELPLASGEVELAERVRPEDTDPHTEVGQVGAALNRMLDHVEGSLAARQESETRVRQFVADASHELRTPLASIRGYAELVRRTGGEVPADVGRAMGRVESEALRMTELVEELLLLARLDAGRELTREEVDLTALVVDAVGDAHVAGPGHRWQVDLPDAPVVAPGDPARLHQVLTNLLANVRSHTPDGTTATVRLRLEAGWAVLQVLDDGPGVPPALRSHVFERFARGDASRSRAAGSTGLGLAIVDAVVTAHGGRVELDSEPGRTAFTVRLPGATALPG
ncbi:HAMP domain-containing histidine kinase [Modestobacter sp. L9-4]|uniref:sensor histidine kinase n=1 Tax=Modestobacter sp. L9-4 TaxID=2851567 RepID=UPI001C787F17|nr:HAMP domain-containing sensor histidine kinase [Modestobacter sp. L9-4]QXG77495.1 HAMP domain-containing histidine kinase [Modestobacter sp. L9-4]